MAQFVLVNVVVAVLMKHLEESNKVTLRRERVCLFFCFAFQSRNNKAQRALSQEAKEDAEIDAEIALEMAMENQRRLSTASNNSSGEGTYVGPCPHSPGQVWGTFWLWNPKTGKIYFLHSFTSRVFNWDAHIN